MCQPSQKRREQDYVQCETAHFLPDTHFTVCIALGAVVYFDCVHGFHLRT